IKGLTMYFSPTDLGPLGPVDASKLRRPTTLFEKMCCIGEGEVYCPTAYHGQINGVHYFAPMSQRGCYPAQVASEHGPNPTTTVQRDDLDHCQCGIDSVFILKDQLKKAGVNEDEVLAGKPLQTKGLPRYLSLKEPLQRGDGTRLLEDFVAQLDGK